MPARNPPMGLLKHGRMAQLDGGEPAPAAPPAPQPAPGQSEFSLSGIIAKLVEQLLAGGK